jgi:periplasmic copper chaperone A
MTNFRRAALAASALITAPLLAHDYSAGQIRIGHPWSRETAPSQVVGAGFMTITNGGKTGDRLLSATSPAAREVQVHTVSMDGGVMRMRQLTAGLPIPAGATVTLRPGSYHIMLIGLKAPLKQGVMVPATLRFQNAGTVSIAFKVEAIGFAGPDRGDHARH